MNTKACLLRYFFPALIYFFPSVGFSQRHRGQIEIEGVSVKTDVLAWFSTALHETKSYSLAGEVYFNEEYSVNAGILLETMANPDYNMTQKNITGQLRWYLLQEDCSCSALFAGLYFSSIDTRQVVEHTPPNSKLASYYKTSGEAGLCAGYQAIFAEHFVVDPSVQAGVEIYQSRQGESSGSATTQRDNSIRFMMQLGVGYRF